MASRSEFDLVPTLLIVAGAFFLINRMGALRRTPTLDVTIQYPTAGISFGSPYDRAPPADGDFLKPEYVRWVKAALNHIMGTRLNTSSGSVADGVVDAVWHFQRVWQVPQTGMLDAALDIELRQALGQPGYT